MPCADPERGPSVRETLVFLGELNRAAAGGGARGGGGARRRGALPASAFAAGVGDDGGDILDVPRWEAGDGGASQLPDAQAYKQAAAAAAARLGVPEGQTQSLRSARAAAARFNSARGIQERLKPPAEPSFEPARLPENIARANAAHVCAECGYAGTRYVCGRCGDARYCSAACQRRHWKAHASLCKSKSRRGPSIAAVD